MGIPKTRSANMSMHLTVIATGENQFKKFILMILVANAAVGVITETNAEKALEVRFRVFTLGHLHECNQTFSWATGYGFFSFF